MCVKCVGDRIRWAALLTEEEKNCCGSIEGTCTESQSEINEQFSK